MDIERERGITIKAQTVRLNYRANDGKDYVLNLIDTPGHVDFAYEVNRSLAACEGSLLVVDASQGVEAQTLANVYQALDNDHEIVPVLNKIDLPAAEPERVKQQIEDVIGLDASNAIEISAKTGLGIEKVLEAIVTRLPPPKGDRDAPLKALLVDSWYDAYLGVVVLVRIVDGMLRKGMKIRMMGTGAAHEVDKVGVFTPKLLDWPELGPGELGFLTGSIKEVADTRVGDTITEDRRPATEPLPGFRPAQPVVFCGIFPVDAADFEESARRDRQAPPQRRRLHLRDGDHRGARLRLPLRLPRPPPPRDRAGAADPRVRPRPHRDRAVGGLPDQADDGEEIELHNPADMPDPVRIAEIAEPWLRATILTPDEYLGSILKLCQERRGIQVDLSYVGNRAMVQYDLPLNEVVFDFYDRLKSVSKGYASFDYHLTDYRPGDLVKMQILVNGEPVDALSVLVHRSQRRAARPGDVREAEGADPAAHVPDPDPGGDRRPDHRPRDHPGAAQGRARQVLWRRRDPQAQASGEAEGRQEADAPVRQGRHPAGGLHRRAEDGRLKRALQNSGRLRRRPAIPSPLRSHRPRRRATQPA